MCILHGGLPTFNWQPLRYSIAALGQMASPVQSCWIMAQYLALLDAVQEQPIIRPEQHLWNHFTRLFQSVASQQPAVYSAQPFQMYIDGIRGTLLGRIVTDNGPVSVSPPESTSRDEENSQRTGRENPQSRGDLKIQEISKERERCSGQANGAAWHSWPNPTPSPVTAARQSSIGHCRHIRAFDPCRSESCHWPACIENSQRTGRNDPQSGDSFNNGDFWGKTNSQQWRRQHSPCPCLFMPCLEVPDTPQVLPPSKQHRTHIPRANQLWIRKREG